MSNDGNPPVPPGPWNGEPTPPAGPYQAQGPSPQQPGEPYLGAGQFPPAGQPYPPAGQPYPPAGQPYPSGQPYPTAGQPPVDQSYPPATGGTPTQAWQGQPQGQQPGFGPGYPGQPGPAGPPTKKKPVALIVSAVVAVLLVAGLVTFLVTRGGDEDPVAAPPVPATQAADEPAGSSDEVEPSSEEEEPTPSSSAPADGRSATEVVEAYLTAIADGDAETAMSFLDPNVDRTLLTDEMLAASNALAPITDIEVGELPEEDKVYGGQIDISFKLGDKAVTGTVSVFGTRGVFDQVTGLGYVSVPDSVDGLNPTVNGVAVEPGMYDAFIGTYELAVDSPYFTLSGQTVETVTERGNGPGYYDADVALNDEGKVAFHATVKAAVDACLASKNLVAGCGLDLQAEMSNGTINEGTITRTLTGDGSLKLQDLKPVPGIQNPFHVRGDYIGSIDVTAECVQNGETGTCTVYGGNGSRLGAPTVDFSADALTVVWD